MGLARLVSAIQQEQLLGTLESLMVTPTTASVVLLGSVVYDLIYVPIRTVVFLIIVSIVFNVSFAASGYVPAILILATFIPFVWGLGSIASASILTYRRGSGADRARDLRADVHLGRLLSAGAVPVLGRVACEAEPDSDRHHRDAGAVDR